MVIDKAGLEQDKAEQALLAAAIKKCGLARRKVKAIGAGNPGYDEALNEWAKAIEEHSALRRRLLGIK